MAALSQAISKIDHIISLLGMEAQYLAQNGTPSTGAPPATEATDYTTPKPKKAKGKAKKSQEQQQQAPAQPSGEPAPKKEKAKQPQKSQASAAAEEPRVDQLDIRVGRIVEVAQHPNADALYVEQIDLGEGQPRQVISGLVRYVPIEKMQNRMVVVVCNLKPAKMRDVMSNGMVLAASVGAGDSAQVDPIAPPEGVSLGERVTFEGYTNAPDTQINPKKKILEKILPSLSTNSDGVCVYKDSIKFMTTKGPVGALPNARVG